MASATRSRRRLHLPNQIAELVGNIARSLNPVARILLQASPDNSGQVGREGQAGVSVTGTGIVAQNRGKQFAGRISLEWPSAGGHLVQHHAQREYVGAVIQRAGRGSVRATCRPASPPQSLPGCCPTKCSVTSLGRRPPTSLASPKSSTFTRPSWVTITLAGFRSRWMIPFSCAAASASASAPAISTIRSTGRPFARDDARERLSLDQLHGEKVHPIGLFDGKDGDNVRVIQ